MIHLKCVNVLNMDQKQLATSMGMFFSMIVIKEA